MEVLKSAVATFQGQDSNRMATISPGSTGFLTRGPITVFSQQALQVCPVLRVPRLLSTLPGQYPPQFLP